jgi:hypothetical protein
MADVDLISLLSAGASGALGGGGTATAILFTKLSDAIRRVEELEKSKTIMETSFTTKHEANANRIAGLERDHAATSATMAAMTASMTRIEAGLEKLTERLNSVPNDLAALLDNRHRRQ